MPHVPPTSPIAAAELGEKPGPRYRGKAAEILDRMDEGFYVIDRQWRFLYLNRSAESFWGCSRDELLGRDMREVFTRFHGSSSHAAHERALQGSEPLVVETISASTGAPILLRFFPDEQRLTVFFRDITYRRQMEDDIRRRDAVLTLAERSAGIGVWMADLTTGKVRGTPQFFYLLGLPPTIDEVPIELVQSVRHPEDRERVVRGFREAIAAGSDSYEVEYRIVRPDGEIRWIFGRGLVTRDGDGRPVRYSGVDLDITERKQREDHVRVVLRELQHRTNNMLSVVQAIARQTAHMSNSPGEFSESFSARLASLSESNRLLVEQNWRGGSIDQLAHRQLASFVGDDERLQVEGPHLTMKSEAIHNLGLAFHELATNATKYGALSISGGRVGISWQIVSEGEEPVCRLVWRETGGPRVRKPSRNGFGRYVTGTLVARALGGKVSSDFAAAGFVWQFDIPMTNFSEENFPPTPHASEPPVAAPA